MEVGNAKEFSMVVGNACDFFMVVGNAYDFSWWLATPMIFHGGWQRL